MLGTTIQQWIKCRLCSQESTIRARRRTRTWLLSCYFLIMLGKKKLCCLSCQGESSLLRPMAGKHASPARRCVFFLNNGLIPVLSTLAPTYFSKYQLKNNMTFQQHKPITAEIKEKYLSLGIYICLVFCHSYSKSDIDWIKCEIECLFIIFDS